MKRGSLVKVRFELEPVEASGYGSETVWAERVGTGRYRLRNSPFYARDVSAEDVVFAEPTGSSEGTETLAPLHFAGVSIRGGHSTYRILRALHSTEEQFSRLWRKLAELGCSYEQANATLLAVDVPTHVDIYAAYTVLEAGAHEGIWEFEEGHCGHPLRS